MNFDDLAFIAPTNSSHHYYCPDCDETFSNNDNSMMCLVCGAVCTNNVEQVQAPPSSSSSLLSLLTSEQQLFPFMNNIIMDSKTPASALAIDSLDYFTYKSNATKTTSLKIDDTQVFELIPATTTVVDSLQGIYNIEVVTNPNDTAIPQSSLKNTLALVKRCGKVTFQQKLENLLKAGYSGMIVQQSRFGAWPFTITFPTRKNDTTTLCYMIAYDSGNTLLQRTSSISGVISTTNSTTTEIVLLDCPICHNSFENQECVRMPCQHIFHTECLVPWLKNHSNTCPMCRFALEDRNTILRHEYS